METKYLSPSINDKQGYQILNTIINYAIKHEDFDKLRFIGQSLDVLCFSKKYSHYHTLFKKIDNYLQSHKCELLTKLKIEYYRDLFELQLPRCETFGPYTKKYSFINEK